MDNKKAVESPDHYTAGGMEVIEIIRAKLTPAEYKGFLKGNVLKYLFRYPHKDGPLDLDKASKYMDWLKQAETSESMGIGCLKKGTEVENQPLTSGFARPFRFIDTLKQKESICTCGRGDK